MWWVLGVTLAVICTATVALCVSLPSWPISLEDLGDE